MHWALATFDRTVARRPVRAGVVSAVLAATALLVVWVPEFAHWFVRPRPTTAALVEAARQGADQRHLDELADMHLRSSVVLRSDRVAAAELALQGRLRLPTFPERDFNRPFSPEDLESGDGMWRLMIASLAVVDVLLDGYRESGQEAYFESARQAFLAFARFETAQWLNRGLLWNDHAIGARVPTLIKFWLVSQRRASRDEVLEHAILQQAARHALLLAKPAGYAWRTSHGIISDLALLQLAAAFPALPECLEGRRIAAERFSQHLEYWVNAEGAVLLHSAGYHLGSMRHLAMGLRLFSLNDLPIPDDWWQRYERAIELSALLLRPDGTLPLLGDTMTVPLEPSQPMTARVRDGSARALAPRSLARPPNIARLLPSAGYAIWWDGGAAADATTAAQTLLTWAYHEGLGHKLADELSVMLWSHGRSWVSNTGYWPYDLAGRADAESWSGSNAPHFVGESMGSTRQSRALVAAESGPLRFIDVERRGAEGVVLRRQVIRLADVDAWVVVDQGADPASREWSTLWTFYPDLRLHARPGVVRGYLLEPSGGGKQLVVGITAAESATLQTHAGSRQPFAGWVVMERTPVPAPALAIRARADGRSPLITSFAIQDPGLSPSPPAVLEAWVNTEHWRLRVPTRNGDVLIRRDGMVLSRSMQPGDATSTVELRSVPVSLEVGQRVQTHLSAAARSYPRFVDVLAYRQRISIAIVALWLAQEVALVVLRWRTADWARRLRLASWPAWLGLSWWIGAIYFAG